MDPTLIGGVVGIILIVVTILLIRSGGNKEVASPEIKSQVPFEVAAKAPPAAPFVMGTPAPVKEDDLNIIEGIGPKIASILKMNGISTFAQLASTDVNVLVKLLKDNGLQFTKPDSWPAQARLAAEGKMDELKAYQERLVAGR